MSINSSPDRALKMFQILWQEKQFEFSLPSSYLAKLPPLNCSFFKDAAILFIIRTNIFDCFIQKVHIKVYYKDVSWKIDYCCLNAHLSESSKELLVNFHIYIRLVCITTVALSMPFIFLFQY